MTRSKHLAALVAMLVVCVHPTSFAIDEITPSTIEGNFVAALYKYLAADESNPQVVEDLLDYVRRTGNYVEQISRNYVGLGLSDDEARTFFTELLTHEGEGARAKAQGALNLLALKDTPFRLTAPTFDEGEPFDLESLRGKIVLVDHWSTSCASCIAAIPRLKEVYDAYRDSGFEVVSVTYDNLGLGRLDRRRIERIEKEYDLSWMTLNASGRWEEISERYGYQGFGQYMLLNRDGTLYAGSGQVNGGRDLAALLDEMLAQEAAAKTGESGG